MKQTNSIVIKLVDTDTFDTECTYYLYEVSNGEDHYFFSTSTKDGDLGIETYPSKTLLQRADFNEKEWHIAYVLFHFLWSSDNGTNTCMDYDQLEEEGISKTDVEAFIKKFNLDNALDIYEEDGVEIYWEFLCSFDLNTCKFFGKERN